MGNSCSAPLRPPAATWVPRESPRVEVLTGNANCAFITDSAAMYLFKNQKCIKVASRGIWEKFKCLDAELHPKSYELIEDLQTGLMYLEATTSSDHCIMYQWDEASGSFSEVYRREETHKFLITNGCCENFYAGALGHRPVVFMFRKQRRPGQKEFLHVFQLHDPTRRLKSALPLESGPNHRLVKVTDASGACFVSQIPTFRFDAPQVREEITKLLTRARLRVNPGFIGQSLGRGRVLVQGIDNTLYLVDMNHSDVLLKNLGTLDSIVGSDPGLLIWFFDDLSKQIVFINVRVGSEVVTRTVAVDPY